MSVELEFEENPYIENLILKKEIFSKSEDDGVPPKVCFVFLFFCYDCFFPFCLTEKTKQNKTKKKQKNNRSPVQKFNGRNLMRRAVSLLFLVMTRFSLSFPFFFFSPTHPFMLLNCPLKKQKKKNKTKQNKQKTGARKFGLGV